MGAGMLGGLIGGLAQIAPDYAGMGLNYLGTGLLTGNWGGTSKERKNVITDTRKLRKTAYQDAVYSLTEAGLNPILAAGATPGYNSAHAVAQQQMPTVSPGGAGTAMAANRQAGVSEGKAPSEIGRNKAGAGLAGAQTQSTLLNIPNILQQWDINAATIDNIRAQAKSNTALAGVYQQDAINKGASAREINQRIDQIEKFGLPGQSWEGLIRQFLTNPDRKNSGEHSAKSFRENFNDKGSQIDMGGPAKNLLGLPRRSE